MCQRKTSYISDWFRNALGVGRSRRGSREVSNSTIGCALGKRWRGPPPPDYTFTGAMSPERQCAFGPVDYLAARADSMASVTLVESGFTAESNRFKIFPSRLMRNLVKFQRISPANGESLPASSA